MTRYIEGVNLCSFDHVFYQVDGEYDTDVAYAAHDWCKDQWGAPYNYNKLPAPPRCWCFASGAFMFSVPDMALAFKLRWG